MRTNQKSGVALVTGASSGIGKAISLRLARDGMKHDFSRALQPEDVANFIGYILKYPDRVVVEEAVIQAIFPDSHVRY